MLKIKKKKKTINKWKSKVMSLKCISIIAKQGIKGTNYKNI